MMEKMKVMFVDDNYDLRKMVKKGLERLSNRYEVISVDGGKECFKELKNGKIPDMILLDVMMPEMNGWDVLAKLRSEQSWVNIPVIFLTAKTDDTSVGLGTLTSDGYITKPFQLEDLINKIEKFFEERR